MTSPPHLRILCFGASITAGWYRGGLSFHPYAIRLRSRLQEQLPTTKITVDVDALPGDTVMGNQYSFRLKQQNKKTGFATYDWVIVQGGGNDLLQGTRPDAVFEQLKRIWRAILSDQISIKVLGLTVTETADRRPQVRDMYDDLNEKIRNHVERGFQPADVCGALPWPEDQELQEKWWDDGLHLIPCGYDLMGEYIANQILRHEVVQQAAKI